MHSALSPIENLFRSAGPIRNNRKTEALLQDLAMWRTTNNVCSDLFCTRKEPSKYFPDDIDIKRVLFFYLAVTLLISSRSTYWFSPKIDHLDSLANSFHYFSEIDQFSPWLVWPSTRKLNCLWTNEWVSVPFPTWKKTLICSTNKHHTCPVPQCRNSLKNSLRWKIYCRKESIHESGKRSGVKNKPDSVCTYLFLVWRTAVAAKVLVILGISSP